MGFHETPTTFQSPLGSGSFSLPTVIGAYISVFPAASRTTRDFVDPETTTSAAFALDSATCFDAAAPAVAPFLAARPGSVDREDAVFDGSSKGSTSGTL